jgi:hypothetical protein
VTAQPPLPDKRRSRLSPVPWRVAIAAAGVLGGEGSAAVVCPVFGEALAATAIVGSLAISLVVLSVVLQGSDEAVERIFRLLRWAANRPEPTAPRDGRPLLCVTEPGTPTRQRGIRRGITSPRNPVISGLPGHRQGTFAQLENPGQRSRLLLIRWFRVRPPGAPPILTG